MRNKKWIGSIGSETTCTLFGLFLWLTSFNNLQAQNKQISYKEVEIQVDGKLDEAVWQQLPTYTGFYNYAPNDVGLAEQQTEVKLFHNGSKLFIALVYHDNDERSQVSSLKRDVPIGLSDGFAMILDTQNQSQNAYYFSVNAYGALIDGLVERINGGYDFTTTWNALWDAKTSKNGKDKLYEVAIPLKFLNFNKETDHFGLQIYVRDIKKNAWTILNNVKRNYRLFDLRFTENFSIQELPDRAGSKFALTPALMVNDQHDVINDDKETLVQPSLDLQYNLTSSLKLDATLNPDFSQIDVDQQVTNLSRFSIFFPERRNFFLENSDLFSNLGVQGVNPFYSRRIGANSDIQFGIKLSGNVAPKSRIGILNVQSEENELLASQNYAVLVGEQQFSKNLAATSYLINRQETDNLEFIDEYNRVTGVNLNYKSTNNRWLGLLNVGKSFSDGISDENTFYHGGIWYNKRGLAWNASLTSLGKNYITDLGFTPRLFNFDAINQVLVREGYTQLSTGLEYEKFYDRSETLNSFRMVNYNNNTYFDEQGDLNQMTNFLNSALFFKDLSAVYYVYTHNYVDLKYGFDPLGNGNAIQPGRYRFGLLKLGYNSANNQKFRYRFNLQRGNYFDGQQTSGGLYLNYQILPFANLELAYDVNAIDLDALGKETFHLARFTGAIFFNTRLNWTTYVQYNTQIDNLNINSRLQWEYKPLSYLYLVVSDNYTQNLSRKDWGVALKLNYRFDF